MGRKRMTPLAQALMLVDSLSPDEQATLVDYLRGKMPKTPRKPSAKKQAGKKLAVLPENPEGFLSKGSAA